MLLADALGDARALPAAAANVHDATPTMRDSRAHSIEPLMNLGPDKLSGPQFCEALKARQVVDEYCQRMLTACRTQIPLSDKRDEAIQDVLKNFVHLSWARKHLLEGANGAVECVETYFVKCVRNRITDLARYGARQARLTDEYGQFLVAGGDSGSDDDASSSPETEEIIRNRFPISEALAKQFRELLRAAGWSDEHTSLTVMKFLFGLSNGEIAALRGKANNRMKLWRLKQRLKKDAVNNPALRDFILQWLMGV